jgi:putative toxin-antitoxin system antitoxin component (TIGR02293 family)
MVEPARVADVLGVKAKTMRDLSRAVEQGLPKQALKRTAGRIFRTRGDVRKLVIKVVPEATYKRRTRLNLEESERTERLARVVAAAEYVWDSREDAQQWLTTKHTELENQTPLECAMTELGARRVEDLLDRIFYGLPA